MGYPSSYLSRITHHIFRLVSPILIAALCLTACGGGGGSSSNSGGGGTTGGSSTGGETNPVCSAGSSSGAVQQPVFVRNIPGQTSWYGSPVVADLNGDGQQEIIASYYSIYVYNSAGTLLDSAAGNNSRIYAPCVVADLEGDGITEIVCGQGHQVYAYEWVKATNKLRIKSGWPKDTTTAGHSPEVRGLAAADLNGDGSIEIVATTTQTQPVSAGGAQVFVFNANGTSYQPAGAPSPAWPRYNYLFGGDRDRNGAGHQGYGCYGLNVGIGNIDDDPQLEIIVTYDNHAIQAFKHTGVAINASSWFTNRASAYLGLPMTWGQFIRWADPLIEYNHYHLHTGTWPNPGNGQEWLQWTASPPNVVDLQNNGRNAVVGIPNVEKNVPYVTQAYAVMVLEGAYGDGSRSAMRLAGWETLPRGDAPIGTTGVPAAATVNIQGDARPEIVVSLNDGFMYAFDADAKRLWRYNYTNGKAIMYASEPMVADLNCDGSPEIIFTTYGSPSVLDSGHLIILAANGTLLHDVPLPNPGRSNGNGNGAPAAPTIADIDGDGQLEILVQTFEHGMDIFRVPGSGSNCLLWNNSRGGPLRMGKPNSN